MPSGDTQDRLTSKISRDMIDGHPVYVKQYVDGGWGHDLQFMRDQAAAEVNIMAQIGALVGESRRLGRMRIVEASPEQARLVTAEVPGTLLQELLITAGLRARRGACVRALVLAGRWQRMLHRIETHSHVPVTLPTEPEDPIEYLDVRLKTLRQIGSSWPTATEREQTLAWFKRQLDASTPEQRERRWSHGDYGPTNLIWDGFALTPIDFATCSLDLSWVDITYLTHRLEMLDLQFPWRRYPVRLWQAACLRGFGVDNIWQQPMYRAMKVRHLVCRLQTLVYYKPNRLKQRLHGQWLCHHVRRRIQRLISTA